MNRVRRISKFLFVLLVFVLVAARAVGQEKKTANGEEYFIVSSIDPTKSQLLLKRPTEVTQLIKVSDKTQFVDTDGKSIRLADLRAGDTVWVTSSAGDQGVPVAVRIRKGPMTVEDLHRYFLDYPVIK